MKKYKLKIHKKKFIKTIIVFVLLIAAVIAGISLIGKLIEQNGNAGAVQVTSVVRDGEKLNNAAAAELITSYFNTCYSSLGALEAGDLQQYFDPEAQLAYQSSLVNQAALEYLVAYRKASVNDLGFDNCTYGLTYTDISEDDDGNLVVELLLDEQIPFRFQSDITSSMSGVLHQFTLIETDGEYLILSHTYEDTVFSTFNEGLTDYISKNAGCTNEQMSAYTDQIQTQLTNTALANLADYETQRQAFNADPQSYRLSISCDHSYNREAAAAYAMQWVEATEVVRNDAVWMTYDSIGGNCNNYVSQCIYAGGVPMDTVGDEIWKWYSDIPDSTNALTGRSASWTSVGAFYDYCDENSGYGIAADVGANHYSANIGDVVIMDWGDGWSHVVLITQVVTDADGNVLDYLINSNTSDRINYPLSAYGCVTADIIRIAGWND